MQRGLLPFAQILMEPHCDAPLLLLPSSALPLCLYSGNINVSTGFGFTPYSASLQLTHTLLCSRPLPPLLFALTVRLRRRTMESLFPTGAQARPPSQGRRPHRPLCYPSRCRPHRQAQLLRAERLQGHHRLPQLRGLRQEQAKGSGATVSSRGLECAGERFTS